MKKLFLAMCTAMILVAVSGCCSKVCGLSGADAEGVKTVGTEEMQKIVEKKTALIFDARSVKYDTGERIPGARVISTETSSEDVANAIMGKNAAVVLYCSSTKCPASGNLAAYLKKLGYTNITVYPEGIEGWKAAGNKIEKPE
ncbi:MAG TPA: hypothetical protein DCZ94_04345 [Lentisphaeria bacterium]|nr:MAG: hypothetical protein A2X48_05570 [Lentisphaerae bacterium GWF2_49_21]HBC86166.1 hypothetical protein [Lentisphaeria bacterium]